MTATTRTPLGASTLVRKWYLDVNTGTAANPVWTGVFGMLNFTPSLNPTLQDDSDFDSQGYKSSTVTALDWGCSLTVSRKTQVNAPTVYDPGQEKLRTTSLLQGVQNSVQVRFYEMSPGGPRVEAYMGNAAVSWSPSGGAMDALDEVAVTLTGQGQRQSITHPDSTANAPVINALSPSSTGVAGGAEVEIQGAYFTGATAVKVNGTALAAANWVVVNDGLIVFNAPAETAGAYPVVVTTPNGTSASVNLTYA
ncbi:MAG TPA: IPT/TIG domain-containing protein [Acidimicrobiales bacterium]|nr:IPT/TIG domain-containing protein [Acidimicrobiales bacterium]